MQIQFTSFLALLSGFAHAFNFHNFAHRGAIFKPEPFLKVVAANPSLNATSPILFRQINHKVEIEEETEVESALQDFLESLDKILPAEKIILAILLNSRAMSPLVKIFSKGEDDLEDHSKKEKLKQQIIKGFYNERGEEFIKKMLSFLKQDLKMLSVSEDKQLSEFESFNNKIHEKIVRKLLNWSGREAKLFTPLKGFEWLVLDRYLEADELNWKGTASLFAAMAIVTGILVYSGYNNIMKVGSSHLWAAGSVSAAGLIAKFEFNAEADRQCVPDLYEKPCEKPDQHWENQKIYNKLSKGLSGTPKKLFDAILNSPEHQENLKQYENSVLPYRIFEKSCRELLLKPNIFNKLADYLNQPPYVKSHKFEIIKVPAVEYLEQVCRKISVETLKWVGFDFIFRSIEQSTRPLGNKYFGLLFFALDDGSTDAQLKVAEDKLKKVGVVDDVVNID